MVENLNTIIDITNATSSNANIINNEQILNVQSRNEEKWMLYYLEIARKRFGGNASLSNIIHALKR